MAGRIYTEIKDVHIVCIINTFTHHHHHHHHHHRRRRRRRRRHHSLKVTVSHARGGSRGGSLGSDEPPLRDRDALKKNLMVFVLEILTTSWHARKSHLASIKCKKTLWRPGLRPGPRTRRYYNAIPDPLAGGEGLAAPFQEPHPRSRPFRSLALALHLLLWYDKDSRLAVYVCSIVVFIALHTCRAVFPTA